MVKIALQYVESVLETSGDDFESTDDLYEAIGEVGFRKPASSPTRTFAVLLMI